MPEQQTEWAATIPTSEAPGPLQRSVLRLALQKLSPPQLSPPQLSLPQLSPQQLSQLNVQWFLVLPLRPGQEQSIPR
jgi:hypothetical protein